MFKRKNVLRIFSMIIILSMVLSGCSTDTEAPTTSGSPTQAEKVKTIELKSADVVATNSPYTIAMNEKFIPLLREKTNGKLNVTHYPAGQLGSDSGIIEGIKLGTIDFGVVGTIPSKVTEAIYLPWLFKDAAHMHRVLDGEIGQTLKEVFYKETNIRMLGFAYYGSRVLTANKPLETIKDLKGLKIRVPQMAPMIATWEALGASPTPLAFTELFTALQSGTVDAQENPYEIIATNSFFEVQKYCMETHHSLPVRFLVVNDTLWQSLSQDEQKAVNEAWKETSEEIERLYIENEEGYKKLMKDKGMTFITPNIDEFRNATKDVWKEFADKAWGVGLYEKIQELRDK